MVATTLACWLGADHCDEGRPVEMLNTRNGFEVDAGAIVGALDWRLARSSDFRAALQAHPDELAAKAMVSFCTGGIRCKKAELRMLQAGLQHVKQLDGGILRDSEHASGAPGWTGRCFVFDERVALDADMPAAPS